MVEQWLRGREMEAVIVEHKVCLRVFVYACVCMLVCVTDTDCVCACMCVCVCVCVCMCVCMCHSLENRFDDAVNVGKASTRYKLLQSFLCIRCQLPLPY